MLSQNCYPISNFFGMCNTSFCFNGANLAPGTQTWHNWRDIPMSVLQVPCLLFSKQVNYASAQRLSPFLCLFSDYHTDLVDVDTYFNTLPDELYPLHYLRIVSCISLIFLVKFSWLAQYKERYVWWSMQNIWISIWLSSRKALCTFGVTIWIVM